LKSPLRGIKQQIFAIEVPATRDQATDFCY
jgi:hypothetical protein